MDLVLLLDRYGEPAVIIAGGALIGAVFGIAAQRSAFCTRSAVLDLTRRRDMKALATWLAGFAVAIAGVQALLMAGLIDVFETRFFSTAQSLSGALVGGLVFGAGMAMTRGCVSRLIVLAASGNLRAAFSVLVVAGVGLATFSGFLIPPRDAVAGLLGTPAIGGNELLSHLRLGHGFGLALGLALLALAFVVAIRAGLSAARFLGGMVVGATVVAGWHFTYTLSTQLFDPIQIESLSFVRPLATTLTFATGATAAGLDQGVFFGVLAGAFIAALASRTFRVERFSDPGAPSILRYAAGAAMMGFGGILAVGCTVGAGLTGGSVMAVSSLLALCAMAAGAGIADRLLDGATAPTVRTP